MVFVLRVFVPLRGEETCKAMLNIDLPQLFTKPGGAATKGPQRGLPDTAHGHTCTTGVGVNKTISCCNKIKAWGFKQSLQKEKEKKEKFIASVAAEKNIWGSDIFRVSTLKPT